MRLSRPQVQIAFLVLAASPGKFEEQVGKTHGRLRKLAVARFRRSPLSTHIYSSISSSSRKVIGVVKVDRYIPKVDRGFILNDVGATSTMDSESGDR